MAPTGRPPPPSELPPHHLVHHARIALDDADYFGAYVFVRVVGHGDAGVAGADERDGHFHALQEAFLVDAAEDEAAFVEGFGAFGAGADAHGGERVADAGEEAAFLGQRAAVADHAECVHLEAVVVMEAQGLVLDHARVQRKAGCLQALPGTRMARVQDGHIILFGHLIDGIEQREEVLLRVNVLLAVRAQQDVLALLQAQTRVDVAGLNLGQILVQHLSHGAAGHIGALTGQSALSQIPARMLAVGHVHVADNVHDAAVGLLGQAFAIIFLLSLAASQPPPHQ